MSMLQETHGQYASFDNNVTCGSVLAADLVVTNSSTITGITTNDRNTVVGLGAGGVAAEFQNVSVGSNAGAALASSGNVVVGFGAVSQGVCAGANLVVIGPNAAPAIAFGSNNVVVGANAGTLLAEGGDNVLIGFDAGASTIVGSSNVIIGSASTLGGDFNGCVALGSGSIGPFTADDQIGLKTIVLSNSATLGAHGAVPVQVSSYLPIFIGAVQYKIPLFNL